MTALGGYTGCWDLNEVEVCYAPYKTNKDTLIRYGPSSSSPKTPLGAVAKGAGLGWQSTRNPDWLEARPYVRRRTASRGSTAEEAAARDGSQ